MENYLWFDTITEQKQTTIYFATPDNSVKIFDSKFMNRRCVCIIVCNGSFPAIGIYDKATHKILYKY